MMRGHSTTTTSIIKFEKHSLASLTLNDVSVQSPIAVVWEDPDGGQWQQVSEVVITVRRQRIFINNQQC